MLDKTYRPAEVEEKIYALWENSGAFAADSASGAAPYCIMMPPPNVTGSLHMGHALTFTLQDILVRYHRLPYLIERLVKKEIDLMVNRAEGLDN